MDGFGWFCLTVFYILPASFLAICFLFADDRAARIEEAMQYDPERIYPDGRFATIEEQESAGW